MRGDHPDQCMSMKEMGNRKGLGSSDPLQGLHLDSLGDGLPQNTDRQQMVDFLDAASLMQPDDSGQDLGLARHCHHSNSGVDLSSLRSAPSCFALLLSHPRSQSKDAEVFAALS